jgi:hypothetical protein
MAAPRSLWKGTIIATSNARGIVGDDRAAKKWKGAVSSSCNPPLGAGVDVRYIVKHVTRVVVRGNTVDVTSGK